MSLLNGIVHVGDGAAEVLGIWTLKARTASLLWAPKMVDSFGNLARTAKVLTTAFMALSLVGIASGAADKEIWCSDELGLKKGKRESN